MKDTDIARLSSLWARQLQAEFTDTCWRYNITLIPPIIEISKSKTQLGSWSEETRTIKISSFLILNHSWAITLEVLKHEIAHQICSEIFRSKEVAHGVAFNKACDILSVPKEYRRKSGDLPENIDRIINTTSTTSEGRRFIDKVGKLLALAESTNKNEATLAMQKANDIIKKYNIMRLDTYQKSSYTYVIINRKKKRIEGYQRRICAILGDFFFVKIVNAYLYDPPSNQIHKTIEILGSRENVAIAEYCYHFLENQLSTLWVQNKQRYNGNARTEKNSYFTGLLQGFYDKLQKQREKSRNSRVPISGSRAQHANTRALIVAEDERLNDYVAMRFPRLRKLSRSGPKMNKNTYTEGIERGLKIILNRGICEQKGNKGNLLS